MDAGVADVFRDRRGSELGTSNYSYTFCLANFVAQYIYQQTEQTAS
jgi:hypothetical protein